MDYVTVKEACQGDLHKTKRLLYRNQKVVAIYGNPDDVELTIRLWTGATRKLYGWVKLTVAESEASHE